MVDACQRGNDISMQNYKAGQKMSATDEIMEWVGKMLGLTAGWFISRAVMTHHPDTSVRQISKIEP